MLISPSPLGLWLGLGLNPSPLGLGLGLGLGLPPYTTIKNKHNKFFIMLKGNSIYNCHSYGWPYR